MQRILVLFGHPAAHRSRANRRLLGAATDLENVTVHDLYATYPDFVIDVAAEQERAERHDVLVFQHPFFWYSSPAIIKEWQDLVLQLGWAYGPGGDALHDKCWLSVVTTGGRQSSYRHHGQNAATMRELLLPFERTAALCGMHFLPPFVVHGTHGLSSGADFAPYVRAYRDLLTGIRDERFDLAEFRQRRYANLEDHEGEDLDAR